MDITFLQNQGYTDFIAAPFVFLFLLCLFLLRVGTGQNAAPWLTTTFVVTIPFDSSGCNNYFILHCPSCFVLLLDTIVWMWGCSILNQQHLCKTGLASTARTVGKGYYIQPLQNVLDTFLQLSLGSVSCANWNLNLGECISYYCVITLLLRVQLLFIQLVDFHK